jgi:hypothetical protein
MSFKDKYKYKGNSKVAMNFDIETLDSFCVYVMNLESPFITRACLTNMHELFKISDLSNITSTPKMARVQFIKKALEARIKVNMGNKKMILSHILMHVDKEYRKDIKNDIIPMINDTGISATEIKYTNSMVADRLTFAFVLSYKEQICSRLEALDDADTSINTFQPLRGMTMELKDIIIDLLSDIRKNDSYDEAKITFDLDDNYENVIEQVMCKLTSPTNKLKTGLQALNEMIDGALEAGRVYMFMGSTGCFKSGILLHIAHWIKKYNKVKTKDQSKRPTVVYITQENTIEETIERLFNMTVSERNIRHYTAAEVVHLLKTTGGMKLETKDDIDLVIKYYPNREISTSDLYSIMDDIEDSGREVICLVHDYIGRIRSAEKNDELRLELAAVADEFHNLAVNRNIPVITAAQLNKDAANKINDFLEMNKGDATKALGIHNVGESYKMTQNVDAIIIIGKEYNKDEDRWYLGFNRVKFRGKAQGSGYFCHPFDKNNTMRLLDDVTLSKPLSKYSMDSTKNIADDNPMTLQASKSPRMARYMEQQQADTNAQRESEAQAMRDIILSRNSIKPERMTYAKEEFSLGGDKSILGLICREPKKKVHSHKFNVLTSRTYNEYEHDDNGYIKITAKD